MDPLELPKSFLREGGSVRAELRHLEQERAELGVPEASV